MAIFNENDPFFCHPPANANVTSLWTLLHDAVVQSIAIEPQTGDCLIAFTTHHLSGHTGIPTDTLYTFRIKSATRLIALTCVPKPGSDGKFDGKGNQDERRREWFSKFCEIAVPLDDVAKMIEEDQGDIYTGDLLQSSEGVSLHLHIFVAGLEFYNFEFAGSALICSRSDGWTGPLDELVAIGNSYWEDFAKKRPKDG